jgi:von Willebrand factor A domain-containing protein 5
MGSDQVFIFLVDRSGSMGNEKMQMAKDALKLFIQSLPIGAMFEVVSFGTDFSVSSKNREGYVNNDLNVKQVKDEIDSYSSNMGGTEILKPMKYTIQEYLINFDYVLP